MRHAAIQIAWAHLEDRENVVVASQAWDQVRQKMVILA